MSVTLATQHRCSVQGSMRCTGGTGKPRTKKCSACGGAWAVTTGRYGVFAWTGTGRYPASAAVRTFTSSTAAERCAAHTDGHVVRWIPADELPTNAPEVAPVDAPTEPVAETAPTVADMHGTPLAVDDRVRLLNAAGGYLANERGQAIAARVRAVSATSGVEVLYSDRPWDSPRPTWFAARGVERIAPRVADSPAVWSAVDSARSDVLAGRAAYMVAMHAVVLDAWRERRA